MAVGALPVAFGALGVTALTVLPPIYRLYTDPAYQYLLNGLAVTVGSGPGHTDHPGTSVQWLVGLVSQAFHIVTGPGIPLIQDVVQRPETYLLVNAVLLVLLQAGALLFLGWRILGSFGLGPALLAQAAVVAATAYYPFRLYVIPESMVIIAGLLLLGLVVPKLARPGGSAGWRTCMAIGVVLAVGLTAKVIFAPLLVVPLFLYGWRSLVQMYAWFLASVVAIMWIARDQLQRMWDWYTAVASTSARYPDEAVTRSMTDGLRAIPQATLDNYPVVVMAALLLGFALVLRFRTPPRRPLLVPTARTLTPLLVATLGTLGMTYKAYRPNDLLLLAPLAGLLAAIAWSYIEDATSGPRLRSRLIAVPVALAVLSVILGASGATRFVTSVSGETDQTRMFAYLEGKVAEGTTVATGYAVFNQASSLYYANEWARYVALRETLDAYPGWIEYNIWNGQFYTFNEQEGVRLATCQELEALIGSPGGLLVAPGRPLDALRPGTQYSDLTYQAEQVFGTQVVYRMQGVTCP